jgi:hypothetical protein
MAKKYLMERATLVNHYSVEVFRMTNLDVIRTDIIKGSEFILTAQDVLENVGHIDGRLVRDEQGKTGVDKIHHSQIELVYNKN